MSIYVVDVTEPSGQKHSKLNELAQIFRGDIYHRDGRHGSFMVHAARDMVPEAQLAAVRTHFAKAGYRVEEKISPEGHVLFRVDVTGAEPVTQDRGFTKKLSVS